MYQLQTTSLAIVINEPYCNNAAHDFLVSHPSIEAVRELIGPSEKTTATSHRKPVTCPICALATIHSSKVAKVVKARRLQKELSPAELGHRLGVHKEVVARIERVKGFPVSPKVHASLVDWLLEPVPITAMRLDSIDKDVIRYERFRRGLSVNDLAARVEVYPMTVLHWETGHQVPGLPAKKRLRSWLLEDDVTPASARNPLFHWLESDFGEHVRDRRLKWEMTLVELATHLGVSVRTVQAWESGSRPQNEKVWRKLWDWLEEADPEVSIRLEAIDGNLIRRERVRRGLTQRELSDRLGVRETSVLFWETRGGTPKTRNLKVVREWLKEEDFDLSEAYSESLESDLGTRLRERRLQLKMSQDDLAERLGCTPTMLWRWESGRVQPSLLNRHKILEWLSEEVPKLNLGVLLRERRLQLGMTQAELAIRLGISTRNTLYRWENGLARPSHSHRHKILEWLGGEAPKLDLGTRLRERRLQLGMTQVELAERLGCLRNRVIAWERGHQRPCPSNRRKIQEWLDEEDPSNLTEA